MKNKIKSIAAIKSKLAICTAIVLSQITLSNSAQAGLMVNINSATAGTSQDYKNTPNHIIGQQPGYFGANIYTDNAETTDVVVEFLGSQAKWDAWFTLSNNDSSWTINNHPDDAQGIVKANAGNLQQGSLTFGANQLVNFSFLIDNQWQGNGVDWAVKNGSNGVPSTLNPTSGRYFWTGFEYNQDGDISAVILGLDDSGAQHDEDNDDLMIRMTGFTGNELKIDLTADVPPQQSDVVGVPVPASLGLFVSALGFTGLLQRKKMASKS